MAEAGSPWEPFGNIVGNPHYPDHVSETQIREHIMKLIFRKETIARRYGVDAEDAEMIELRERLAISLVRALDELHGF